MCRCSRVTPDGLAWSLRHRRPMMEQPTRFVGMDVHKDTIVVAVTAMGDVGRAIPYGTFPNTAAALEKLAQASAAGRQRAAEVLLRGWSVRLQYSSHSDQAGRRQHGGRTLDGPALKAATGRRTTNATPRVGGIAPG